MTMHASITENRIIEAVQRAAQNLDNPGFCIECGADAEGCEPDMRNGECEACEASQVYGAEECLFMVVA
jgi:hypothetical protein